MQLFRFAAAGLVSLTLGCAAQAKQAGEMPAWDYDARHNSASREAKANATVNVRGIEGTLSAYDVQETMELQGEQFATCQEPRAHVVPVLAGSIEFGISVRADGKVQRVDVFSSDLGDRVLERCFADVILDTTFRRPNGGDAKVTYTMILSPAAPGKEPEAWSEGRIGRLVAQREPDLREACGLGSAEMLVVTAYVDPRGRVVAAGVAAREGLSSEQFDCVAEDLHTWPMPKAAKRFAKVSFALGSATL